MTNETLKTFWELMVGIAVLIFTAYTVWKDFYDKSFALLASVFIVFGLMIALAFFALFKYYIDKKAEELKIIDNSPRLKRLEEEIEEIKKRLDELEKKS